MDLQASVPAAESPARRRDRPRAAEAFCLEGDIIWEQYL